MKKEYKDKDLSHYDADFYHWTIDQHFDKKSFWIQDIDALVRDRNDNLMLLEIKRRNYSPKPYQKRNMKILDHILRAGIEALNGNIDISIDGKSENHQVNYHGFKLLQLSGDSFSDSDFKLNGRNVTSDQLAKLLSFDKKTTSK